MTDNRTTELQSLSKLKTTGKLRYWRGTIEMPVSELHAICDEIQAEHDRAIAATLGNQIDADLRKAIDFMRIWIVEDAHLGESAISRELEKAEGLRKLDAIENAIATTLGGRGQMTTNRDMCSHYEPKDGVVAILREAARNLSDYHDAGEALRRLTDTTNVYHALETLADMIERDYVRRESIEEVMDNDRALVEENSMLARELLKLRAELDAAKQQISKFDAPKSVETSENPASKREISDFDDSRELLEADISKYLNYPSDCRAVYDYNAVIGWLDRQAAITERETTKRHELFCETCEAESDKQIAELTAERDLLTDDDANDDSTPENGVSDPKVHVTPESCRQYADQRKQGDDADCESCDSREQLEADVRYYYTHTTSTAMWPDSVNIKTDWISVPIDKVLGWLDRQAAITQHEITERWAEHLHPIERECGDLRRKVDELEADNDRLANLLSKSLEEYSKLEAERDELKFDISLVRKNRDKYRSKFGKCLDYADAIHALMDEGMA